MSTIVSPRRAAQAGAIALGLVTLGIDLAVRRSTRSHTRLGRAGRWPTG